MKASQHVRKTAAKMKKMAGIAAVVWCLPLKEFRFNESLTDCYGQCWLQAGMVEMKLFTFRDPEKPYRLSRLQEILAHELAHLACHGHGRKHREMSQAIRLWLVRNWNKWEKMK